MTAKERVQCALSWGRPDRVPIEMYLTPEMGEKLTAYFGGRSVSQALGVDFRRVNPDLKPAGLRRPKPAGAARFNLEGATRKITTDTGATYVECVSFPMAQIQTMRDIADWPWNDPDNYDYSTMRAKCDAAGSYAVCVGGEGTPDILNGLSRARGMEQVMMDIAARDEVGLAIIDKYVSVKYEVVKRALEAADGRIDIVRMGEDCGNQNGRMFSKKDFDEIFRPQLQKFIDLAHAFGAKAMMHSCGDTHELMPTFIEMGLDVLDAMQPEPPGMQPLEKWRGLCRGKMAFCGLISTQNTLPFGTEAECRAEARHRLDVIAPGGGYIFAPAHCIQPDTPLRNVIAIYEEALGKPLPPG